MAYEVQTPVFEGPFDLLLHLILREQVDLYESGWPTSSTPTSPSSTGCRDPDLEVATEFLLIAATLVELKSRRLLPGDDDVDLDDELALWEERDLLLARLLECKTFKDAAVALDGLAVVAGRSHPRTAGPDERFSGCCPTCSPASPPTTCRTPSCGRWRRSPCPRVDLDHVAPIRASVTDAVAELLDELPRAGRITLPPALPALVDRLEVVVRFLAVLELFKQGLVELEQFTTFGDIDDRLAGAG